MNTALLSLAQTPPSGLSAPQAQMDREKHQYPDTQQVTEGMKTCFYPCCVPLLSSCHDESGLMPDHGRVERERGGCVWRPGNAARREGGYEPLYEMSSGLDIRWDITVYIHILHEMLHSWALWSNPIDAGMRLSSKKNSLLH